MKKRKVKETEDRELQERIKGIEDALFKDERNRRRK
jgi:hypothetical protein